MAIKTGMQQQTEKAKQNQTSFAYELIRFYKFPVMLELLSELEIMRENYLISQYDN